MGLLVRSLIGNVTDTSARAAIWFEPSYCDAVTIQHRKGELGRLLHHRMRHPGLKFNDHITGAGDVVFRHACAMGLEGIVSKRLGSPYRSGRSKDWVKIKNPAAPAMTREAEEDWGKRR
jgi:ATP-dependent DNA ligase